MPTRIRYRRATAAQWTTANSILFAGEPGVETDTGFIKVGDGTTDWNSLPYYAMRGPATAGTVTATASILPIYIGTTRQWTLSANLTISALPTLASNAAGTVTLVLKQAAAGGPYTVTWPTIVWAEGVAAPVMPTVANAELVVHLFWTGQAWRGVIGGNFFP